MNTQPPQRRDDFEHEIDDLVQESLEHEYAVYVRLHEDTDWPAETLQRLVADLHPARPRVERVDAPAHDVVISVDGDGLDAQEAARHAVARIAQAAAARGLTGHAAEVTVLSENAVWAYDEAEVRTW